MENSIKRVPSVENAEVIKLLNGPEGFTPDGEFLLGPTSVKGFWVACAFCAHGLAGAGGIGKTMAEWIVDGHPEWDVWRLDVRRFGSNYNSQDYTVARMLETYTQYYDIHYPGEERLSRRGPAPLPHLRAAAAVGLLLRRENRLGTPQLVQAVTRRRLITGTSRRAGCITTGHAPSATSTS